MKKLTALIAMVSFAGTVVAGPVAKQQFQAQEAIKLAQAEKASVKVLQVQAGGFSDDYGVAVIAGVFAVAALTVGIIAIAD